MGLEFFFEKNCGPKKKNLSKKFKKILGLKKFRSDKILGPKRI